MKKLLFTLIGCAALLTGSISTAQAQNYKTALGVRIDAGDGSTGVGFNVKHFFTRNNAIDGNLIFFDGDVVGLGAEYQYNAPVQGVSGLDWYLGVGPNFLFHEHFTQVQLRPVVGLDLKVPNAPIDFAFDWRPMISLNHGSDVTAGRFGISIRYAF
ncbi:hypothetical protein [Pedobacter metabolipauper]|uniref:Outer membrane protein n=1 Tax=Pedobacter metabolipauper TaxID=425513 RepID=A0A4R6T008_9SPHI|nr:hypothetical protein [Pedobacter metabolipauper]TDQ10155.1 hypothetical protein ATK78_2320 [Pedobacter metabolipauper]